MSIAGLTDELTELGDDGAGARDVEARGGTKGPPKDDAAAQFAVRMRNGSALYLATDPRFGSLSLQRKHVETWIWKLTHALSYARHYAGLRGAAKEALVQARKDRAEEKRAADNAQMASELDLTASERRRHMR